MKSKMPIREWELKPILDQLKQMEERLMSALDDLQAKMDAINTGQDTIAASLTKNQTDIDKTFADLKALIAASGNVDLTKAAATADAVISKQSAAIAALAALDADAIAADPTVPTVTTPAP